MKTIAMNVLCLIGLYSSTVIADTALSFPDVKDTWTSEGRFVNQDNLKQMRVDMSPRQIAALIGYPQFQEGFTPKIWNYVFNFRINSGNGYTVCQYQIHFKDRRSVAMYWKDSACQKWGAT